MCKALLRSPRLPLRLPFATVPQFLSLYRDSPILPQVLYHISWPRHPSFARCSDHDSLKGCLRGH